MVSCFVTQEVRINGEERMVSAVNGAGKTGQPHAKN